MWNCLCDCGVNSIVGAAQLSRGWIKSCGCLRREKLDKATKTHGMHRSTIYRRWTGMKSRCKDVKNPVYGKKGITYDSNWEKFENFYEDMAEGFEEHLELDRIDVRGDYCKSNCRWVTHNENNYNKNIQPNNISGKTGVNLRKDTGMYRAYITVDRKQRGLGEFKTFEEAVIAREAAEMEIYGYKRDEK
jgi:hypothetical protein